MKDSEAKNGQLVTEATRARGSGPTDGNSSSSKHGKPAYWKDLLACAKKFSIVGQPWVEKRLFEVLGSEDDPQTSQKPFDISRFDDNDSYDRGTIAMLYQTVPKKLHKELWGLDKFQSSVSEFSSVLWLFNGMFV